MPLANFPFAYSHDRKGRGGSSVRDVRNDEADPLAPFVSAGTPRESTPSAPMDASLGHAVLVRIARPHRTAPPDFIGRSRTAQLPRGTMVVSHTM